MTYISISPIKRYFLFINGLLLSTIIPSQYRGLYLWCGTFLSIIISIIKRQLTSGLLTISLAGLGHSTVHLYWPFLDAKLGYVPNISAFPDVLFHTIMLIYVWINIRKKVPNFVQTITILSIFGSTLNCIFTNFKNVNNSTYYYLFFNNPYYLVFNLKTNFTIYLDSALNAFLLVI